MRQFEKSTNCRNIFITTASPTHQITWLESSCIFFIFFLALFCLTKQLPECQHSNIKNKLRSGLVAGAEFSLEWWCLYVVVVPQVVERSADPEMTLLTYLRRKCNTNTHTHLTLPTPDTVCSSCFILPLAQSEPPGACMPHCHAHTHSSAMQIVPLKLFPLLSVAQSMMQARCQKWIAGKGGKRQRVLIFENWW